jgi:hypothetical protein
MPRKKTIPLEHHLTQLLALRGVITMRSAMHYTGVIPPDPKGGGKACDHGAEKAADGRCVACKREADQRLYRNKAYRKAIASLVEQGIARPAGDGRWAYAGKPPMAGPKARPRLPAEPGRVFAPDLIVSELMTAMQALISALPADHGEGTTVFREARRGRRQIGHSGCMICDSIEDQSITDHETVEDGNGETPAQTIRVYRERQPGHERCNICDDIAGHPREDAALTDRLRRYESAMSAGRSYAYMPDGRRIQSDGSLCDCSRCDERVRVRTPAARTGRLYTSAGVTTSIMFDTVTMTPVVENGDNSYEEEHSARCLDEMANHPEHAARAEAASGYSGYHCYARRGHTGDHIGWSAPGRRVPSAWWPQAEEPADNGMETDYTRQCRDGGNPVGYICTARAGHSGNHMGWYEVSGEPRRNDDATWPQVTSGDDTRVEEGR